MRQNSNCFGGTERVWLATLKPWRTILIVWFGAAGLGWWLGKVGAPPQADFILALLLVAASIKSLPQGPKT